MENILYIHDLQWKACIYNDFIGSGDSKLVHKREIQNKQEQVLFHVFLELIWQLRVNYDKGLVVSH